MFYYTLLLGIGIYVIGYQLIIQKQYIKKVPIRGGTIHASLTPSRTPPPVDMIRYCTQSAWPSNFTLPCISLFEPAEAIGGRLLIGTRLSRTLQRRDMSCGDFDYGCQRWTSAAPRADAFFGGIEKATVTIQHDISNFDARDAYAGGNVGGAIKRHVKLSGEGGSSVLLSAREGGDQIGIGALLQAAGVDLESPEPGAQSGVQPRLELQESVYRRRLADGQLLPRRFFGITVVITTEYQKSGSYSYHVDANHVEAPRSYVSWGNASHREWIDLHGIQLVLVQATDGIPHFEFRTMLLSLASGIALASTAKLLANLFLLYVAPHRHDYRLFVETKTPDFSPDTAHERSVLTQVISRKRSKQEFITGQTGATISSTVRAMRVARKLRSLGCRSSCGGSTSELGTAELCSAEKEEQVAQVLEVELQQHELQQPEQRDERSVATLLSPDPVATSTDESGAQGPQATWAEPLPGSTRDAGLALAI